MDETFSYKKPHLTENEIKRSLMAAEIGISPNLLDVNGEVLKFEKCDEITNLFPYYKDIYDLLLKGVKHNIELLHCDPGVEGHYNVMLLKGKPVLIDWGEENCKDNEIFNYENGDHIKKDYIIALDALMCFWAKKDLYEKKITFAEMKDYIYKKYNIKITETTPYEKIYLDPKTQRSIIKEARNHARDIMEQRAKLKLLELQAKKAKGTKKASPKGVKKASPKGTKKASPKGVKKASPKGVKKASPKGTKKASPKGVKKASPKDKK